MKTDKEKTMATTIEVTNGPISPEMEPLLDAIRAACIDGADPQTRLIGAGACTELYHLLQPRAEDVFSILERRLVPAAAKLMDLFQGWRASGEPSSGAGGKG